MISIYYYYYKQILTNNRNPKHFWFKQCKFRQLDLPVFDSLDGTRYCLFYDDPINRRFGVSWIPFVLFIKDEYNPGS